MASKRKLAKDTLTSHEDKIAESIPRESEDEALGQELDLDKSDDENSDDSDSSVYSELEEDEDEESEQEDEEEESDADSEDSDDQSEETSDESEEENSDKKAEKSAFSAKKAVKKKSSSDAAVNGESSSKSSSGVGKEAPGKSDEYAYDSSDEEDVRNTIGNIPTNWYDEYGHIGYDLEGKKIRKPKRGDELEFFLSKMENPEHGVTVDDPLTGQNVVLSEADADVIKRLQKGRVPDAGYNMYTEWSEWFSSDVLEMPVRGIPETKQSFLPSVWEKKKVSKMVHAIKMGWMKPRQSKTDDEDDKQKYYMLWQTDDQVDESMRRVHDPIPAPKMRLPGHEESYNPPAEYLFTEKEKKEWERATAEGDRRKLPFVPQKYSSLRKVPAWSDFIKERFERCLDLYLAPRARKMRLTIQPEDLVPQLPRPQDLQPFPTVCSITYKGHKNMIRSISMEPKGQYFISGSDDGLCKVWEIQTGRCLKTFNPGGVIKSVAWCPNSAISLVAIAVDTKVLLINVGVGDRVVNERTVELLSEEPDNSGYVAPVRLSQAVRWSGPEPDSPQGTLVVVHHFKTVKQVTWHGRGDYFAAVLPEGANRSVVIHQLSKWRSQLPFSKSKGQVQSVLFHPVRPYLFVATQKHVRIYDLVKQELTKKLMTGAKWISSMAIHPGGDNLLLGTFDKKVQWFDLDLSSMPYQVLRYHTNAVRGVDYHRRYPLFASCGDDNCITVSHGMVYSDLLQNPLIVPVKRLTGHTIYNDFGVMCLQWHPAQPWLLSAGADGYIKLWT